MREPGSWCSACYGEIRTSDLARKVQRIKSTHRLPPPPAMAEFLSASQSEGGIKHRVVHGVANYPMRLRVEALRKIHTRHCHKFTELNKTVESNNALTLDGRNRAVPCRTVASE